MQHPSTKNCVLSWQGTTSERVLDWFDNLNFFDVTFCGLGEYLHGGFVDQLRTILDTQSFRNNIQTKLPKCNELTVVGHSLGGALAALYSYCLNAGSSGGADNNRVKFTRYSTPRVISPVQPFNCNDLNSDCGYYATQGYCSSSSQYFPYMMETCCSSCQSGSACQDLNSNCAGWAGVGYCSSSSQYYAFMMENCCASCNR